MTITIITKFTEIRPGQFVCGGTSPSYGCCTGPRKVISATPARINYRDAERQRNTFMSRSNALYLCDTAEEGMAIFNLTYEREQARDKAEREVSKKVTGEYAPRLRALMGLAPVATGENA